MAGVDHVGDHYGIVCTILNSLAFFSRLFPGLGLRKQPLVPEISGPIHTVHLTHVGVSNGEFTGLSEEWCSILMDHLNARKSQKIEEGLWSTSTGASVHRESGY
jgi:hypothetical protein